MTIRQNSDQSMPNARDDKTVVDAPIALPDPRIVTEFEAAVLSSDRSVAQDYVKGLRARGITPETIADDHIPQVAMVLGEKWCSDQLSFADVTIGSARLQSLLRELGPEWTADACARADAPTILMVACKDSTHTLGAILTTGQLRRRGYSVRLVLDADHRSLPHHIGTRHFDAAFISASVGESLEKIRKIVDLLRGTLQNDAPVVLGGGVLGQNDAVAALTGVDYATSDLDEALELCGLILTPPQQTPQTIEIMNTRAIRAGRT